jgi:hypothetical protein
VVDYFNSVVNITASGGLDGAVLGDRKIGVGVTKIMHDKLRGGICRATGVNGLYRPGSDLRKWICA